MRHEAGYPLDWAELKGDLLSHTHRARSSQCAQCIMHHSDHCALCATGDLLHPIQHRYRRHLAFGLPPLVGVDYRDSAEEMLIHPVRKTGAKPSLSHSLTHCMLIAC